MRDTSNVVRGRGGQGLWSKEPGPGPVRPNPKSERSCRKLDDRLREVRDLRPQKVPGGTVQRLFRVKLSLLKLLRPVKILRNLILTKENANFPKKKMD